MPVLLLFAFLLSFEYWDRPPEQWTQDQVETILTASPWGRIIEGSGRMQGPPVLMYLASAEPLRLAEEELRRRDKKPRREDMLAEEYRAWLAEDGGKHIVLAVRVMDARAFDDAKEVKRMEKDCSLKIGKKKVKIDGHFPPSSTDPFLRLAFPRDGAENEKMLQFELYLPGVPLPFRIAEFLVKDMIYKGKIGF